MLHPGLLTHIAAGGLGYILALLTIAAIHWRADKRAGLGRALMTRDLLRAYKRVTEQIDTAKARTQQSLERQDEIMRELEQERERLLGKDDAPESH